jgi:hypothetical protein
MSNPYLVRLSAAALSCAALLGGHEAAHASVIMDISANVCRPMGDSAQTGLSTSSLGVYVTNTNGLSIVCPAIRSAQPSPNGGVDVWVDYQAPVGAQVNCTVTSVDEDGSIMGTANEAATGNGQSAELGLWLPASEVWYYSTLNVYCTLGHGVWMFDIEPDVF